MSALFLFLLVFGLLLLGFPVAFTLGGVSLLFGFLFLDPSLFQLLPMRVWGVMTNYVLIAVPLFVFMGVMLERSGVAEELLDTMTLLFGRLRGGLAVSVVVVGALLAASTGIVGATVVTMGLLSLPTMLKRGYSPETSAGTIAAAGTLGQIIPPSIVLILLGSILNVPIGDMFMGAVFPGLLLVGLYLLWIAYLAIRHPEKAPALPLEELQRHRGSVFWKRMSSAFLPPFLLILLVLGSIFAGIASPTEAAGIGALGATFLTLGRRRLGLHVLRSVMRETTLLTTMVFTILVGATVFGLVFRGLGGDRYLAEIIMARDMGSGPLLLLVMLIIFVSGFFIDFIEITFIIVPVVAPLLVAVGVDPLWFGILVAVNLQTSFLTPPFGFALFYLKGVAPDSVTSRHLYRGIVPFIVIQLIGLGIILLFPGLVQWLPRFLG